MAVSYLDVVFPWGRIAPDMFPGKTTTELYEDISDWIVQAEALPRVVAVADDDERDRAVAAWVYWRAFDAALIALAANPATSAQTDAGSASYAKDQRDTFARLSREARAEFDALAPPATSPYLGGGTRTVHHTFS